MVGFPTRKADSGLVPGLAFMFAKLNDDIDVLSAALRCSPSELRDAVSAPQRYCRPLTVRRRTKSSRPRTVWLIDDPLRRLQRQVALWLRPIVDAQPVCVTAFRHGASTLKNAKHHSGRAAVLTADLSDFFGSITLLHVVRLFESLGCGRQVAVVLGRLTTLNEKLVQGGRASPFIANLVASELDFAITELSGPCRYTRYVDDLTISGELADLPSEGALSLAVNTFGFKLRNGSYRVVRSNGGPFVTGLQVGSPDPKAPRHLRRQVERFLRFAEAFTVTSAAARTFKRGKRATDPAAALQYVRGLTYWLRPIDASLSIKWGQRLDALHTKLGSEIR